MNEWPDVRCDYDDGSFDKDEQGWCARCTRIEQDGARVTLREWGDDNGMRGYDDTRTGEIAEVFAELGLVKFGGGLSGYYFDLTRRRVRSAGDTHVVRFAAGPDYLEPAWVRRAIDAVATVVEAVGGRPAPRPEPPPWPELAPSETCWGSHESAVSVDAGEGRAFRLRRRVYDDGSQPPQLIVDLVDGSAQAYLFIRGPDEGQVALRGPLERHGLAAAILLARLERR